MNYDSVENVENVDELDTNEDNLDEIETENPDDFDMDDVNDLDETETEDPDDFDMDDVNDLDETETEDPDDFDIDNIDNEQKEVSNESSERKSFLDGLKVDNSDNHIEKNALEKIENNDSGDSTDDVKMHGDGGERVRNYDFDR